MMKLRDLHHDCDVVPAYAGGTIATDTDTDGIAVDLQGYDACEFALYSGTITDGTYALTILECDTSGGTYTAVDSSQILGAASFVAASDSVVKRIGYVGYKQFVKLRITSTGTTSGGVFKGAVAIKASPRHAPVADN